MHTPGPDSGRPALTHRSRRTRCYKFPAWFGAGCLWFAGLSLLDGRHEPPLRRRARAGRLVSIPEGTENAELKKEALRLARELLRGTKYEGE
jgi:hypothetical protein